MTRGGKLQQLNSVRGARLEWKAKVKALCEKPKKELCSSTRRELQFISIKLPRVSTSLHHSSHKGTNLIQIRARWIEMDRDQQSVGGRWRNMAEWRNGNEDNTTRKVWALENHDSWKISKREGLIYFNGNTIQSELVKFIRYILLF